MVVSEISALGGAIMWKSSKSKRRLAIGLLLWMSGGGGHSYQI